MSYFNSTTQEWTLEGHDGFMWMVEGIDDLSSWKEQDVRNHVAVLLDQAIESACEESEERADNVRYPVMTAQGTFDSYEDFVEHMNSEIEDELKSSAETAVATLLDLIAEERSGYTESEPEYRTITLTRRSRIRAACSWEQGHIAIEKCDLMSPRQFVEMVATMRQQNSNALLFQTTYYRGERVAAMISEWQLLADGGVDEIEVVVIES